MGEGSYTIPRSGEEGYPIPRSGWGEVPHSQVWTRAGGTPYLVWPGGYPNPGSRRRYPGVPHPGQVQGQDEGASWGMPHSGLDGDTPSPGLEGAPVLTWDGVPPASVDRQTPTKKVPSLVLRTRVIKTLTICTRCNMIRNRLISAIF